MPIIRTKLATDWPERSKTWLQRFINSIDANPDYVELMHLVDCWLVEFDDDGDPAREIALDKNGNVLFSGPDKRNYGFWLDTSVTLQEFSGEEYDETAFEELWKASCSNPAT